MIQPDLGAFTARCNCSCIALDNKEILIFGGIASDQNDGGIFILDSTSDLVSVVKEDVREERLEFKEIPQRLIKENRILTFAFDRSYGQNRLV